MSDQPTPETTEPEAEQPEATEPEQPETEPETTEPEAENEDGETEPEAEKVEPEPEPHLVGAAVVQDNVTEPGVQHTTNASGTSSHDQAKIDQAIADERQANHDAAVKMAEEMRAADAAS